MYDLCTCVMYMQYTMCILYDSNIIIINISSLSGSIQGYLRNLIAISYEMTAFSIYLRIMW